MYIKKTIPDFFTQLMLSDERLDTNSLLSVHTEKGNMIILSTCIDEFFDNKISDKIPHYQDYGINDSSNSRHSTEGLLSYINVLDGLRTKVNDCYPNCK